MNQGKKKTAIWLVLVQGSALSLGIYLTGVFLLTLGVVKGSVSETVVFPVLTLFCILASLSGGLSATHRLPWGTLPSAMLVTVCFVGLLALIGILRWEWLAIDGSGGVLLLSAIAGGALAGIMGGQRKVNRKKHKALAKFTKK